MRTRASIIVVLGLMAPAHADHHGGMAMTDEDAAPFAVGVSLVAARFDPAPYYGGDYEGEITSLRWASGRFAVGASLPMYRLDANGLTRYGLGDAIAQAQVTIYAADGWTAGAALAVSVPTGDDVLGFGMGHLMAMPAAVGSWTHERVTVSVTGGFGRALVDLGGHNHGMWPLVEPMNMSELEAGVAGDVVIAHRLHGGLRVSGGLPIAAPGNDRVIGAARLAWGSGSVESAAEVQTGLAGDPFTVRGIVETALRF